MRFCVAKPAQIPQRKEAFADAKAMVIKMKETLENLWDKYLEEECAVIDTEEERKLTQKTLELHEKASSLLNEEQKVAVEKYVDALCDLEAVFAKKAFIKGCEFAVSFLLESKSP